MANIERLVNRRAPIDTVEEIPTKDKILFSVFDVLHIASSRFRTVHACKDMVPRLREQTEVLARAHQGGERVISPVTGLDELGVDYRHVFPPEDEQERGSLTLCLYGVSLWRKSRDVALAFAESDHTLPITYVDEKMRDIRPTQLLTVVHLADAALTATLK